ncbi:MAG TPA: response regulator [Povalibacter sp.]|uniref:response regulator transcription factor n=1 Tax=Povalibacter sp. TaxID=1962978 RepID=UPI002CB0D551|nr:response regulator [Povalibacter sp.]HMN45517.1 response regulator [Povalibacter sp.]
MTRQEGTEACVHLVDDDESFTHALSRLLRVEGIRTSAFASAGLLLDSLRETTRGCVVADLNMPGISGLELQERLAHSPAPMPIVFLTGCGDIPASVRAMRNGALDFLEKRAPREALLGSIHAALQRGDMEFSERTRGAELSQRFRRLTAREMEVLQYVVDGRMNKQIAAMLGINERTVKLHRTAITRKLGVHSAALLATLSHEAHVFDRPPPRLPDVAYLP